MFLGLERCMSLAMRAQGRRNSMLWTTDGPFGAIKACFDNYPKGGVRL